MSKISIVIPIYNVELYLRRCLNSILAQTFTDYECILVDDCSPDNCPSICDEYVKIDFRFKVIHKNKNEGLPKARKTGLDMSIGEFVMHVDSDDWIERNALEILLNRQHKTGADIVIGGFKLIFNRWSKINMPVNKNNYNTSLDYLFNSNSRFLPGKLYRRECFEKYQVPDYSIGEGSMVNVQIFKQYDIEKITTVMEVVYNYDRRSNISMMSNKKKKYVSNSMFDHPCIKNCMWIKSYLESVNSYEAVKTSFLNYMIGYICIYLIEVDRPMRKDINYIYDNIYFPFSEKINLSFYKKLLLVVHKKSIFLGRIYVTCIRIYDSLRNGKMVSGG